MTNPLAFAAIRHRSLAAAGLGGGVVMVALTGETLMLTGRCGEQRDLLLASVTRLRVGYAENKYAGRLWRMMLWTGGGAGPLTLATIKPDEAGFAAVARAIATTVERTRGAQAVEAGLSWYEALMPPVVVTILFVLVTLAAWADPVARGDDPFPIVALAMMVFELPVLGVVLWFFTRAYRPRTVGGVRGLGRVLPQAIEKAA